VLTGEGRLDGQTAKGKVISGVLAHAFRSGVPVVALAGIVRWGELGALYEAGLAAAFSIQDGPTSLAKAMARTGPLVTRASEAVIRLWTSASAPDR
jgi:glycerate kinase